MTNSSEQEFETISAFLDDALPESARRTFLERLVSEPDLAARVEAERRFRNGLRATLSDTSAPTSLRNLVTHTLATERSTATPFGGWRARRARGEWLRLRWWMTPKRVAPLYATVLALALILIMGGSTWAVTQSQKGENHSIFRQMAGRHRVYFGADLPQPALDVTGTQADLQVWLRTHVPFPPSHLTAPPGRQIAGARLGEFHHQRTVSLLYVVDAAACVGADECSSTPVSLTLFSPQPKDFPAESRQIFMGQEYFIGLDEGFLVVVWRENDTDPLIGYSLVGDPVWAEDDLLTLASTLRSAP